uniref:Uncharacterized protein n=1 Tax=Anguilla anguilla TaxID=7936 RepID=A0A0E9UXB1_ANGAN
MIRSKTQPEKELPLPRGRLREHGREAVRPGTGRSHEEDDPEEQGNKK